MKFIHFLNYVDTLNIEDGKSFRFQDRFLKLPLKYLVAT